MDPNRISFMSISNKATEAFSRPTKKPSVVVAQNLQGDTGTYISCIHMLIHLNPPRNPVHSCFNITTPNPFGTRTFGEGADDGLI